MAVIVYSVMDKSRKTIVVFDDSPIIRDLVEEALEARDFDVRSAGTVGDLDLILDRSTPDLFVLDLTTPEVFGDDVAHVLRVIRKQTAPILLFSAADPKNLAERVAAVGLDGYVSKTEGVVALVDRILELLGTP
jgi:DNA-binding response OmpR family regulator